MWQPLYDLRVKIKSKLGVGRKINLIIHSLIATYNIRKYFLSSGLPYFSQILNQKEKKLLEIKSGVKFMIRTLQIL